MPTGLAIPVGVNSRGGARLVSKDEQASKIIALALSDLDNDNAFQQGIGLGSDIVFDPAGATFRARVRQRIIDIFKTFEDLKLYKLVLRSMKFGRVSNGEQELEFKYINLESDEEITFEKSFFSRGR